MSNQLSREEEAPAPSETDNLSTWDEVRRVADELELKIHLANMDARDRWQALQPRLTAFEHRMKDATQRASKTVVAELQSLWSALRGLRDDIPSGN